LRRPSFAALLAICGLVLSACGTSSTDDARGPSSPRGEAVTFEASDGVKLVGRIFGDGEVGVVLAHMGRWEDTQADWYRLARALAERGYTALTYNRRGVCSGPGRECSGGPDDYATSWKDVVGASGFVRARGATDVVLIGASIGAMASLHALATRSVEAAALIEICGVNHRSGYDFSRKQLEALEGDKLLSPRPTIRTVRRTRLASGTVGRGNRSSRRSFRGAPTVPTCWSMVSRPRSRSWSSC
jgi:pimeloyl-ACP methyl ester carboxylesterase